MFKFISDYSESIREKFEQRFDTFKYQSLVLSFVTFFTRVVQYLQQKYNFSSFFFNGFQDISVQRQHLMLGSIESGNLICDLHKSTLGYHKCLKWYYHFSVVPESCLLSFFLCTESTLQQQMSEYKVIYVNYGTMFLLPRNI